MKLEIKKGEHGEVELRRTNDDGSIDIWLCDSEQVAFYKLMALVFERPEPPANARRNILVGTFKKKSAESQDKPSLEKRVEELLERLKVEELEKVEKEAAAPDSDMAKWLDLLKKTPPYAPSKPFGWPGMVPMDQTYPGLPPGTTIWCSGQVQGSAGVTAQLSNQSAPALHEELLSGYSTDGAKVNVFKTSFWGGDLL